MFNKLISSIILLKMKCFFYFCKISVNLTIIFFVFYLCSTILLINDINITYCGQLSNEMPNITLRELQDRLRDFQVDNPREFDRIANDIRNESRIIVERGLLHEATAIGNQNNITTHNVNQQNVNDEIRRNYHPDYLREEYFNDVRNSEIIRQNEDNWNNFNKFLLICGIGIAVYFGYTHRQAVFNFFCEFFITDRQNDVILTETATNVQTYWRFFSPGLKLTLSTIIFPNYNRVP